MWQRFTERARKVVFFAQEESQRFGDGYVSTEHLLLGLCRELGSTATEVIAALGVSLTEIRAEIESHLPRSESRSGQDMTLTPRAKRVIDLAYEEARNLGNNFIGTEHLLLGLIREADGMAGRVLTKLGVVLEQARRQVIRLQDQSGVSRDPALPPPVVPPTTPQTSLQSFHSRLLLVRHRSHPLEILALLALSDGSAGVEAMLTKAGTTIEEIIADVELGLETAWSQPTQPKEESLIDSLLSKMKEGADCSELLIAIAEQGDNGFARALSTRNITPQMLLEARG